MIAARVAAAATLPAHSDSVREGCLSPEGREQQELLAAGARGAPRKALLLTPRYHRAERQPAARASASEQNHLCPRLSFTVVFSYQGEAGVW